jgi:hypothetical protein
MEYIVVERFKRDNALGRFNLPRGTRVEEKEGWLYHNGCCICSDHSAIMRDHFARNDDGNGLKRGDLSHAIVKALRIRPDEPKEAWNKRWEPIWKDPTCQKYRKDSSESNFLWSIEFYNAPLADLEHIALLSGAKKGKKTV